MITNSQELLALKNEITQFEMDAKIEENRNVYMFGFNLKVKKESLAEDLHSFLMNECGSVVTNFSIISCFSNTDGKHYQLRIMCSAAFKTKMMKIFNLNESDLVEHYGKKSSSKFLE